MKNLFTFLLFISLPALTAQAQKRVSFSPTVWFNYGTYTYQLRYLYPMNDALSLSGNVSNRSYGLTARYHIDSRLDVSAGLLYSEESQNGGGRRFNNSYVRLPVLVNYRSSAKRLSPYMSLGASLSNEMQFSNNGGIKTNALVGLGANYRFTNKLSLLLQPTASYLVNRPKGQNITFDKYYFYQVGLQTQLVWNL
jgi:hypothetical protein